MSGQDHENAFFHARDDALIAKMRDRLSTERREAELKASTDLENDELLHHLAELGIGTESLPFLHLVPLLDVAWADGLVQAEERVLLLNAAEEAQVTGEALEAFKAMIETQPSPEYMAAALHFTQSVLAALPAAERETRSDSLVDLAKLIAQANGGLFGLFFKVENAEQDALDNICAHLSSARPERAQKMIDLHG